MKQISPKTKKDKNRGQNSEQELWGIIKIS